MATHDERNFITETRSEFVSSAEIAIIEIKNKFAEFHSQLHQGEVNLINYVEKIRADILQKFDEMSPKLKEIQDCRNSVISILTNNSNKQLLDTQLHSFTTEIDGIIGQSGIENLIRLKWIHCNLQVDNICVITDVNSLESDYTPTINPLLSDFETGSELDYHQLNLDDYIP